MRLLLPFVLFFGFIVFIFALAGNFSCRKTEVGDERKEDAVVVSKKYVPEEYTTTTSVDTDGGISIDTDYEPPHWYVTFKCEHGQFTVERGQGLYDRVYVDQKVTVKYKEVFWVNENEKSGPGKKLEHKDYWFQDAEAKPIPLEAPINLK
jgi:hypothetical protein